MPIPVIAEAIAHGIGAIPYAIPILKISPWLFLIWIIKMYCGGASNQSERLMRSKTVLITGGTSGIGAAIARDLAIRGAQIIILTQRKLNDAFLVEYLEDLREISGNEMIYAEEVDLASLLSIRSFATRWINNAPPRRLDMIIMCADTLTPRFAVAPRRTVDDLESVWGINYLSQFHLITLLSPAIKAQPPDRDVRLIFATCASHIGGDITKLKNTRDPLPRGRCYETSKLASMIFAQALQRQLDSFVRPDKQANNVRVMLVDPGMTRTPGMVRWITMGSLWGLVLYFITWPLWWLLLKSPMQGAQSFLSAAMDASLSTTVGGQQIKECRVIRTQRPEILDESVQKKLWDFSEQQIKSFERESAQRRAKSEKTR